VFFSAEEEEIEMNSKLHVSLWSDVVQSSDSKAGKELLSGREVWGSGHEPHWATAMLAKGARRLRDLERGAQTSSRTMLEASLSG